MAAGKGRGGSSGSSSHDKKSIMHRGAKNNGGGAATKKQKKVDNDNMNDDGKKSTAQKKSKSTTLEELIDAVSDDDYDEDVEEEVDDDDDDDDAGEESDENEDEKRARALRKMIRDGKFDQLLKSKTSNEDDESGEEEEDDYKEDDDEEEDEEEEEEDDEEDDNEAEDDEQEEEDDEEEDVKDDISPANYEKSNGDEHDDDDEDSSSSGEENDNSNEKRLKQQQRQGDTSNNNSVSSVQIIALQTSSLAADRHLPWPESFAVTAVTPLPFTSDANTILSSTKKVTAGEILDEYEGGMDTTDGGSGGVDVHDDLAREVAFYDTALECTTMAREQCDKFGIPFARPEDFFAEMVKSDDHMAKIKDRLIYETKKMDAVQRRKSNKEHTLMAKERNAHRLAEKAKAKKAHMSAVDDWKKDAERNRGRHVGDSHEDEGHLRGMMSGTGAGGSGPNKRRESANKRYGFGGKNGRFKQNDKATLNDMSGFNPRGGFAGGGRKSPGGAGGGGKKRPNNSGGSGKKRPGKRARDSARSR